MSKKKIRKENLLFPCPFCGSRAKICGDDVKKMYYVTCVNPNCNCAIGEKYDECGNPKHTFTTEEDIVKVWNRRSEWNN
jgi:hypothetical protein